MKRNKSFLYICMSSVALIYILPFYILTNLAMKAPSDISSKWIVPKYLYVENFINAWNKANIGRAILNNMIITIGALVLVVLIGACASYPLARFKSKLNNTVFTVIIACMIVPALTILVPLYKFIVDIHGINTYWAVILVQVTFSLPLTVFLYTGFISSVPKELDEAALLDGCSRVGIFFRIILPLLKPITSTVIILNGVSIWNDYQFSIFFLQSSKVRTIPVALSTFFSQFQNDISYVAAGCIMGMLPLVVLYLILQKYFIKGIADGAVKG